jgi:hypothetical protein
MAHTSHCESPLRLSTWIDSEVGYTCPARSSPKINESAQAGAVPAWGAECDLVGLGALEIEMRGVLPGHADAAMELYGLLGSPHREDHCCMLGRSTSLGSASLSPAANVAAA